MRKLYKIILFLIALVFLSTFNPKYEDFISKKKITLFEIENIEIKNNSLVKKEEVINKIANIYKRNIFLVESADIEEPLKKIDFLDKIEVKKKYPNTIEIIIFETKPTAILFKDKNKYLLDSSSNLININENDNYDSLPKIFGDDAENNFLDFLKILKKNNFPLKKIKNFYYYQIKRWDLELMNNKIIKLPHQKIDEAIIKSLELLNRDDFKRYNIIDLRISDKIIVE